MLIYIVIYMYVHIYPIEIGHLVYILKNESVKSTYNHTLFLC